MGDVLYTQNVQITAARNTSLITEKDFEIFPAESWCTSLYNEDFGGRYALPDLTVDLVQGMGTLSNSSGATVKGRYFILGD